MIGSIIFILLLIPAVGLFYVNARMVRRNILLGRDISIKDQTGRRWGTMARVALGQSKMVVRPLAGILHIFVYAGFIIINIEILEILTDGVFGTHRAFAAFSTPIYNFLIGSFELLALSVIVGCTIFFLRRNVLRLKRFWSKEMTLWPRSDANIILITEISLMLAFLSMNACDHLLQGRGVEHYIQAGSFPVSVFLNPVLSGLTDTSLILMERSAWWFHIIGVLAFMNYIPYSKHFHIVLAFPNTYFSKLLPKGQLTNMASVTREVKLMLNPSAASEASDTSTPSRFGVRDIPDLTWKNLMDAYSCTECGRCTSVCPANLTGKTLSPRKIMMDTRDRLEEFGKNVRKHGRNYDDGKSLHNYVTQEELWACTTCNACTEACPVNIDPLEIIVEMRRFLVMEQSAAPTGLNMMFGNIENNGAPWQFSPEDRLNWAKEAS